MDVLVPQQLSNSKWVTGLLFKFPLVFFLGIYAFYFWLEIRVVWCGVAVNTCGRLGCHLFRRQPPQGSFLMQLPLVIGNAFAIPTTLTPRDTVPLQIPCVAFYLVWIFFFRRIFVFKERGAEEGSWRRLEVYHSPFVPSPLPPSHPSKHIVRAVINSTIIERVFFSLNFFFLCAFFCFFQVLFEASEFIVRRVPLESG